jgi:triacylglycerol lipase
MIRALFIVVPFVLPLALSCGGGDAPSDLDGAVADGGDALDADVDAGRPRDGGRAGADGGGDGGDRLGPPYPIVLAHGFFGFEDFAGAGFLTYFYEVKDELAAEGELLVYTPSVDPFNDSTVRGAMLLARVEEILAETGHAKVNLVGHSQGGLDARVVAHDRPDLVASVTTIATPHRGSRISDVVLGLVSDPQARDLVDALVRVVGAPLYDAVGEETSVVTALGQFSTDGVAAFNAAYPDRITVDYYSVTGVSGLNWGSACSPSGAPTFVARWSGERDPIDPLLAVPEAILDGGLGDPFPNDGLVRVVDARWGTFLGCVPADHLDEVGQLLGDGPGLGNDFDYRAFYVELVRWLREQGY